MEKIAIIVTIGLANYLIRATPFLLFGNKQFPETLRSWLEFVPIAVLTAILGPMLLLPAGSLEASLKNTMLIAAIPTFIIAIISKNMGLTLALGVVIMALLNHFF